LILIGEKVTFKVDYSLTLLDLTSEQLVQPGMDTACIPSIFIKTSQFFLVKAV
jgi:hypothetical protein